jgi:hypothetical protein
VRQAPDEAARYAALVQNGPALRCAALARREPALRRAARGPLAGRQAPQAQPSPGRLSADLYSLPLQQLWAWRLRAPLQARAFQFFLSLQILHDVRGAVPCGSVFNQLNGVEFRNPTVDHADVIENEGLLSFYNRTLRFPRGTRLRLSGSGELTAGAVGAAGAQPINQFGGGIGICGQA